MRLLARTTVSAALAAPFFSAMAFAQDEPRTLNIPNPMGAHTWFIIFAIGAFLLWCISYTIQLQKEAVAKKKGRDELLRQKEDLLDQIAELETRREANELPDQQYRRQVKDLRHRLGKLLEMLGQSESQRPAKRGT